MQYLRQLQERQKRKKQDNKDARELTSFVYINRELTNTIKKTNAFSRFFFFLPHQGEGLKRELQFFLLRRFFLLVFLMPLLSTCALLDVKESASN